MVSTSEQTELGAVQDSSLYCARNFKLHFHNLLPDPTTISFSPQGVYSRLRNRVLPSHVVRYRSPSIAQWARNHENLYGLPTLYPRAHYCLPQ